MIIYEAAPVNRLADTLGNGLWSESWQMECAQLFCASFDLFASFLSLSFFERVTTLTRISLYPREHS